MQGALLGGAYAVLWLTVAYLVGLGVAILAARDRAHRFLVAFAQTSRANWTESLLRTLVGSAFIMAAPMTHYPLAIRVIGAFLAGTAVILILFPGLHRRFAAIAVASVAPFLPLLGIASIALGLLLALINA